MLFNSLDFAVFLPIVFAIYWLIGRDNVKGQNILIVVASYLFYGWWDPRFLLLILLSTIIDFIVGRKLGETEDERKRKYLLWISLSANLGLLFVFKYYGFFVENFVAAFSFLGMPIKSQSLNIILPVGISFYTFQTLSYTIDVYKKQLRPTQDFISFAAFVSFFPQLVAGPIERATHLLPQIEGKRTFNGALALQGGYQILWGLFKKVVIADNAATLADAAFATDTNLGGSTLLLGAVFFAFQIYGDFSGYSDIAIGVSKLFGIQLMTNFKYPYFSRDIAEFWRRWHISLSTWFRDYLYIPLGGSKGGQAMRIRNTMAIFIISGFWHGANWTFLVWGALNAVYFLPLLLLGQNRKNLDVVAADRVLPSIKEGSSMLVTFGITVVAWIFFRAESISHAMQYIKGIFSKRLLSIPRFRGEDNTTMLLTLLFIMILIVVEWMNRKNEFVFEHLYKKHLLRQSLVVCLLTILIFLFAGSQQDFIYFQF